MRQIHVEQSHTTHTGPSRAREKVSRRPVTRRIVRAIAFFAVASLLLWQAARAEIPLPDAIVFGRISNESGQVVTEGEVEAVVTRGGVEIVVRAGRFVEHDEGTSFVVRVPLETDIGAPGPSGQAATEGDRLAQIRLNGEPVATADVALSAGQLIELNGETDAGGEGDRGFRRGDCNSDVDYNISDGIFTLGHLFLGDSEPLCREACDSNDDASLDLADALFTFNHLFLGTRPPPAPGAVCGPDPSAPGLGCSVPPCE